VKTEIFWRTKKCDILWGWQTKLENCNVLNCCFPRNVSTLRRNCRYIHFHDVLFTSLNMTFKYIKSQNHIFHGTHTKIWIGPRYWIFFNSRIITPDAGLFGQLNMTWRPSSSASLQNTQFVVINSSLLKAEMSRKTIPKNRPY
jgi:hypothetical protein